MLDLLKAAVAARLASWDTTSALEEALGYPDGDVPQEIDEVIYDSIATLANSCNSPDDVAQEHVDWLLKQVKEAE